MSELTEPARNNRRQNPDIDLGQGLQPILCTIPQAAALIGRGTTFIYGAIGDGRIKAVKSDKRTLVVVDSLRAYAASLPPAKIKPLPKRKHHQRKR